MSLTVGVRAVHTSWVGYGGLHASGGQCHMHELHEPLSKLRKHAGHARAWVNTVSPALTSSRIDSTVCSTSAAWRWSWKGLMRYWRSTSSAQCSTLSSCRLQDSKRLRALSPEGLEPPGGGRWWLRRGNRCQSPTCRSAGREQHQQQGHKQDRHGCVGLESLKQQQRGLRGCVWYADRELLAGHGLYAVFEV